VLGLGIEVREDNGGQPGTTITNRPIQVGETFWIDVVVQDQRSTGTPQGVISLPLDLVWDPNFIELVATPPNPFPDSIPLSDRLVTDSFTQGRFYDEFNPDAGPIDLGVDDADTVENAISTLEDVRGAALPAAPASGSEIGIIEEAFSQLQFEAIAVSDRIPITMLLAGSMAFADADVLEGVDRLDSATDPNRSTAPYAGPPAVWPDAEPPERSRAGVTEYIRTASRAGLSGVVYVDEDLDGVRTVDDDGVPIEMGLPNVAIQLFNDGNLVQQTVTGPDGEYRFEGLGAGTYRIVEMQPECWVDEMQNLGGVPRSDAPGLDPRGEIGENEFFNITLEVGEAGVDYNFGERTDCITKNLFLASTQPREILGRRLGVNLETVEGTDGDDQFSFVRSGNMMRVVVQPDGGTARTEEFTVGEVDAVIIEAGDGNDTLSLTASDLDEVLDLVPGHVTLRDDVPQPLAGGGTRHTWEYGALALDMEATRVVDTGGGDDLLVLHDSPGDDELTASGGSAGLIESGGAGSKDAQDLNSTDVLRAIGLGQGDDTADTNAVDYVFELLGNWVST
jgi:hypothetical protein